MCRFRSRKGYYHQVLFGLHGDGALLIMILTPDGEIVAQCGASIELAQSMADQLLRVIAQKKLREV